VFVANIFCEDSAKLLCPCYISFIFKVFRESSADPTESWKGARRHRSVPPQRHLCFLKVTDEANLTATHELRALRGERLVGVVMRVRHLTVGHPHHRLVRLSLSEGPLQDRPVHPVTEMAGGKGRRDATSITQDPSVRYRAEVAGTMAVPHDESVRRSTQQGLQSQRIEVHGSRLIDDDDSPAARYASRESTSLFVGSESAGIPQYPSGRRRSVTSNAPSRVMLVSF